MIPTPSNTSISIWKEILPICLIAASLFLLPLEWSLIIVGILLFVGVVYGILFHTERLWWIAIAVVPLSLDINIYFDFPLGLYLPSEPLLIGFMLLSVLYFFKYPPNRKFINHPITLLIIAYYFWMGISVITSVDFVVSIKRFISHMWFIIPILILGSMFMQDKANRVKFMKYYIFSFSIVVLFTLGHLIIKNFPVKESQFVMRPFFKDHTILGAGLGLTVPYIYLKLFQRGITFWRRVLWATLTVAYTTVLMFTYSRAALLSLIIALGLFALIYLRVRFTYLLMGGLVAIMLILTFKDPILQRLESNSSESSGDLIENLSSASNVSSDASNVERINRWNSALRMAEEKPLFGWGPGTYQFEYAPFQESENQTIISTNFGTVGNAHSEYLSALSESGWPAAILFTLFVIVTMGYGYQTVMKMPRGEDRLILLSALLGFTAYFSHGVLNNFLDSDKISVLIWGFVVIIVHYSIEYKDHKHLERPSKD